MLYASLIRVMGNKNNNITAGIGAVEWYLSTEPSTKSLVPTIDIRSATRWLWEIILNACKL